MRVEEFNLKKVPHRSFYKWSMDSEYTWILVMNLDEGKAVMKITCTTCILFTASIALKSTEKKTFISELNWSKIAEINKNIINN